MQKCIRDTNGVYDEHNRTKYCEHYEFCKVKSPKLKFYDFKEKLFGISQ